MLEIAAISLNFGGLAALEDVSLKVAEGQIFSVIGPNGAGKSTLFNVLTGIYPPATGAIHFLGRKISKLPPQRIARRGIGRTFQNIRLFGSMTVFENVLVGRHTHIRYTYADALLHTPRYFRAERSARDKVLDLLNFVGLEARAEELARNLSYGDQRRLEIARAMAIQPRLLLLDEPAAGMNPRETDALKALIRALRDERRITILLIEHHMQVVMAVSDRIAVLDHGRLIAEGAPAAIRENPAVIEAYLGPGAKESLA